MQRDLYAEPLEDGTISTQKETELSQVEGEFSKIIAGIIHATRSKSNLSIEPSDEDMLRRFINCQIERHPYIRESIQNVMSEPKERLKFYVENSLNHPLNSVEHRILEECQENSLDNANRVFVQTLNVADDDPSSRMPALRQRRIGICKLTQDAGEFVIGDRQFVIIPSKTGVWLLYPISYDVGVLWGLTDRENKLVVFDDPRWVVDINKESFRSSEFIAGRSEYQIQKLLEENHIS